MQFYLLRLILGKRTFKFTNFVIKLFRQHLHFVDNPDLAKKLELTAGDISRNYEVFVTPMCHGYICDSNFNPTMDQTKDVIDQVIAAVEQLSAAGKTHNDIKPKNLLYLNTLSGYDIKLSDFGQAGKMGGTPGWTAPVFLEERKPGREDVYSAGLVILRLLCYSKELFQSLRDNYIGTKHIWLSRFRGLVEINFVMKLLDLDAPLTIQQVKNEWSLIEPNVRMITYQRLLKLGVPSIFLKSILQPHHAR